MKYERPFSVCASVKKTSLIGTEKNHLWPVVDKALQSHDDWWQVARS
jgi:hypothetical protein